jgi:hypothetical protein
MRVNSTRDTNYGAEGHPQVEPGAFWVDGMYKRYFDRTSLERLFNTDEGAAGWQVIHKEERTISRYAKPKVVWEVALTINNQN